MYTYAAYAVEVNGALQPQLFHTRVLASNTARQNGLPETSVVQLFRFVKFTPSVKNEVVIVPEVDSKLDEITQL